MILTHRVVLLVIIIQMDCASEAAVNLDKEKHVVEGGL